MTSSFHRPEVIVEISPEEGNEIDRLADTLGYPLAMHSVIGKLVDGTIIKEPEVPMTKEERMKRRLAELREDDGTEVHKGAPLH